MIESHRFSVVVRSERNSRAVWNWVDKALSMYVGCAMPFDSVSVTAQPQNRERAENSPASPVQQLKAEILPLLKEAKKDLSRAGMLYSEQCIIQAEAKLSAV